MPVFAQKSITVATSAATAVSTVSDWVPLNQYVSPFNVGFGVVKSGSGAVTYKVEHTFDDIFDSTVTPTAFTHEDVSAATANIDGNYAFPVAAIRLAAVTASSSAALTITVRQAG